MQVPRRTPRFKVGLAINIGRHYSTLTIIFVRAQDDQVSGYLLSWQCQDTVANFQVGPLHCLTCATLGQYHSLSAWDKPGSSC